jgi:hypothetical protein
MSMKWDKGLRMNRTARVSCETREQLGGTAIVSSDEPVELQELSLESIYKLLVWNEAIAVPFIDRDLIKKQRRQWWSANVER